MHSLRRSSSPRGGYRHVGFRAGLPQVGQGCVYLHECVCVCVISFNVTRIVFGAAFWCAVGAAVNFTWSAKHVKALWIELCWCSICKYISDDKIVCLGFLIDSTHIVFPFQVHSRDLHPAPSRMLGNGTACCPLPCLWAIDAEATSNVWCMMVVAP
jgi:hypothetical protein